MSTVELRSMSKKKLAKTYLAAVSTGLASPNTFSAGTGLATTFSGTFSLSSEETAPSASFVGVSVSRGIVRGSKFSLGRSRGFASRDVENSCYVKLKRREYGDIRDVINIK